MVKKKKKKINNCWMTHHVAATVLHFSADITLIIKDSCLICSNSNCEYDFTFMSCCRKIWQRWKNVIIIESVLSKLTGGKCLWELNRQMEIHCFLSSVLLELSRKLTSLKDVL